MITTNLGFFYLFMLISINDTSSHSHTFHQLLYLIHKQSWVPTCTHSILERTLIEEVWGETRQFWMHSILYFQPEWTNSQDNQSLEQWLWQASTSCLLAHHHWAQLAMVSNQDQLGKYHISFRNKYCRIQHIRSVTNHPKHACTHAHTHKPIRIVYSYFPNHTLYLYL